MSDAEVSSETSAEWVDAVGLDELTAKGKLGVTAGGVPLLLVWLPDKEQVTAFYDICIHKQRNLSGGVILNGKIVCPGHQWSFDLETGHCVVRDRYQPTYRTEIVDGRVHVDISAPVTPPDA